MGRQSYYALLGLSENATPGAIQHAFEASCVKISAMPEGEDKRNQSTFVTHARDVLLDVAARNAHDRELAAEQEAVVTFNSETTQSPRRWVALSLTGATLIALTSLVSQRPATLPLDSASPNRVQPSTLENLPILAESAGLVPVLDSKSDNESVDEPLATRKAGVSALSNAEPLPVDLMMSRTPLFDKIIDATYAIVGSQTMGTGVAIEKDRLLTNCHVLAPNVLKGKIYAISAKTSERFEITQAAFLIKDDACVALVPGLVSQPLMIGETKQLRPDASLHNLGFADGVMTLSEGRYLGTIVRSQQTYLVSTNYCVPGISGGALVNDQGLLLGITSGGTPDHRYCASLTAETARTVLNKSMIPIDAFPTDYLTNFRRRW